jgi:hypothetical protein
MPKKGVVPRAFLHLLAKSMKVDELRHPANAGLEQVPQAVEQFRRVARTV